LDDTLKPASPPAGAAAPAAKPLNSCADVNFNFPKHPTWNPRIKHACEVLRDSDENMVHLAIATISKAMFIFLPLIAFLNMLLYWRPRYRYAEQLLFFVHLHAFYFSVAIIMLALINAADALPSLGGVLGFLETILGWTLPVYTVMAMRRVFRRGWPGTLFKGAVLFFVYMIALGLTVAGAVVYAAFQL
jgi:hypothetical protein